jgi:hypothetical protein
VTETREKLDAAHIENQRKFWAKQREMQKKGESTRMGLGPHRTEFSVTIVRLEDSVIDGTKLMAEFNEFATREGLMADPTN